jgi:NADH:ubiquinone oxidoreductase subunit
MTITTKLYTALFGELVGTDNFGNRYFRRKGKTHGDSSAYDKRAKEKRWVMYKGIAEPSKVPAEWHGWLHYTLEAPPSARNIARYKWERQHQPNLTGTPGAYMPPGHLLKGGDRDPATSDYEAWKP